MEIPAQDVDAANLNRRRRLGAPGIADRIIFRSGTGPLAAMMHAMGVILVLDVVISPLVRRGPLADDPSLADAAKKYLDDRQRYHEHHSHAHDHVRQDEQAAENQPATAGQRATTAANRPRKRALKLARHLKLL